MGSSKIWDKYYECYSYSVGNGSDTVISRGKAE